MVRLSGRLSGGEWRLRNGFLGVLRLAKPEPEPDLRSVNHPKREKDKQVGPI